MPTDEQLKKRILKLRIKLLYQAIPDISRPKKRTAQQSLQEYSEILLAQYHECGHTVIKTPHGNFFETRDINPAKVRLYALFIRELLKQRTAEICNEKNIFILIGIHLSVFNILESMQIMCWASSMSYFKRMMLRYKPIEIALASLNDFIENSGEAEAISELYAPSGEDVPDMHISSTHSQSTIVVNRDGLYLTIDALLGIFLTNHSSPPQSFETSSPDLSPSVSIARYSRISSDLSSENLQSNQEPPAAEEATFSRPSFSWV